MVLMLFGLVACARQTTSNTAPSEEPGAHTLAYGTGKSRRLVGSEVHLGQYLIVMERIAGEWKIVQHFSLNVK